MDEGLRYTILRLGFRVKDEFKKSLGKGFRI
jgi:hypothetical protein